MSLPRFLADHDLKNAIVRGVRRLNVDAQFLRVRDFGLEEAADDEFLAFAGQQGLIVVSHDVPTMTAAAKRRIQSGEPMHGLLLVYQNDPIGPAIDSLIFVWAESEAEEWVDQIQYLPL